MLAPTMQVSPPIEFYSPPYMSRPSLCWLQTVACVLLAGLSGACSSGDSAGVAKSTGPLVVYCAASNKAVVEAISREYEAAYHIPIQLQFGPSQALLSQAEVSKSGDLFLPADDSYLSMAASHGLIAEQIPIAQMQAVVAVAQGNPKQIKTFADLLRSDVRVAQASPDAAAIGKLTKEHLTVSGQWDALHKATQVYATTVNEVANSLKVGAVDAGIVFDAVLADYPTLESVQLPELSTATAHVAVAVLQSSTQPTQALHFARYLSAEDKGLVHYKQRGFQTLAGDTWSEHPELTLFAGSMLRPAIEATLIAFEKREGVTVNRVFNGCGILVAQMNSGTVPDAYFACDVEFMKAVQPLFDPAVDVAQNELVIVVQKGNPHGIASLKDLTKPGIRVGIGHEKQCAMGWLTQRTLNEGGLQAEVMKNVVVQSPTGDFLVNKMRTGALDAAVAYLSNAAGAGDALDAVRITGLPCSIATQPFAVRKNSGHHQLSERLLTALRGAASRERFTQEGFRWIETRPTP